MALPERQPGTRPEVPQLYYLNTGLPTKYPVWTGLKEELRAPDLSFGMPKRNSKPVEIFSEAEQKIKLGIPRVVKNMYHRGNFEGFWTAVGIDALSTGYFFVAIPALTAIINTAASLTDFQLVTATAVAGAARIGYKSLRKDAEALDKKHFATNSFSTGAYGITGKPYLAAGIGHLAGISAVTFGNPIGIFSIFEHDASLFTVNVVAAAIAAPSWYLYFNSRIARGEFDRTLNPIREKRHAAWEIFKKRIKR